MGYRVQGMGDLGMYYWGVPYIYAQRGTLRDLEPQQKLQFQLNVRILGNRDCKLFSGTL